MCKWFASQGTTGSGNFTRKEPNHSAKKTYNLMDHAEGLVWIAEALGADTNIVRKVAREALGVPRAHRKRSAFVREHLPWKLIAELAIPAGMMASSPFASPR